MTNFSLIKLECPVCGEIFSSGSIRSCGYASKRTDFRPNYWGMNPVKYFYYLCPHCGFCASGSYFGQQLFSLELIRKIKELSPLKGNKVSSKLERAMICLELMNATGFSTLNTFEFACHWIEPYWWADNESDIKKYGKIVIEYLAKAFNEDSVPEDKIHCFKYLMGEIYRRIEKIKKAHEIFDILLSDIKNDRDNPIYELASQQKLAPKEDISL
jgi:hypothetical protein